MSEVYVHQDKQKNNEESVLTGPVDRLLAIVSGNPI